MKVLKRWLLIALALVIVLITGLGVFVAGLDANDYKDQIIAQVKTRTGRVLVLDGPLKLALWPRISLTAGPLRLANAAGFGDQPLLSAELIQISIATAPLLSRRVEMDTLVLHGVQLNLARNAAGVMNWADLIAKPAADPTRPEHSHRKPLTALILAGIDIQDGRFSWHDEISGQHFDLTKLTATTDALRFGQPIALKMSAHAQAKQPAIDGDIELKGTLNYNVDDQHYVLAPLALVGELHGAQLPAGRAQLKLDAGIEVDLQANTASVNGLTLNGLGLNARADLKAEHILSKPSYSGNLTLASFDLRRLLKTLNKPLPKSADAQAFSALGINTGFAGSATAIKLAPLDVTLDTSHLRGEIEVAAFSGPQLNFTLALDAFDVDRYRHTPAKAGNQAIITPDAALAGAANALPVAALRTLRSKGSLSVGALKVAGATLNNVQFAIDADHGLVKLQPLAAQLYGGRYDGAVVLDARGKQAKLALTTRLAKVQLTGLLQDTRHSNSLAGVANFDAALEAMAGDALLAPQTLNGTGHFGIADGVLRGIDALAIVRAVEQIIACRCVVPVPRGGQTQFRRLAGTLNIKSGVVHNDDLRMIGAGYAITGHGMLVDLKDNTLKYDLQLAVSELAPSDPPSAAKSGSYEIPIACRGAVDSPTCLPDFRHILGAVATDAAKKKIEKALGKHGDVLKNLLKF